MSPTLAARRPYLAPTISAEELNYKWVSPQFKQDERESCKSPDKRRNVGKRRKNRKAQQGEKQNKVVQRDTCTNPFPELIFESSDKIETCLQQPAISENEEPLRRSTRINHPNIIVKSRKQEKKSKKNMSVMFSLGSPKSPPVLGEILAQETPENEVLEKRLERHIYRNRRK